MAAGDDSAFDDSAGFVPAEFVPAEFVIVAACVPSRGFVEFNGLWFESWAAMWCSREGFFSRAMVIGLH